MTKIEALKKTIYNLENNLLEYDWSCCDTCNCGVLAKTILNTKKSLWDFGMLQAGYAPEEMGLNAFSSKSYCMITGIQLPEVFRALKETGFSFHEICDLENCINYDILKKMGREDDLRIHSVSKKRFNPNKEHKEYLIQYLKAWVEVIKEENAPTYPDITKELAVLPVNETTDTKTVLV